MPLQPRADDAEPLLRAVAGFPLGASVSELVALPALGFSRRTLQRRLELFVAQGRLVSVGQARARRYVVPAAIASAASKETRWLSEDAIIIRDAVQRPLIHRHPVGYDASFLGAYRPNKTFYLSTALRRELTGIGQVGMSDLPAGTYLRQVLDRLLIDLSWNSSRLEGNTYSLLETQRLIELGETAEGRKAEETQMILNHKAAIEMLAGQAEEIGFNRYTICNLHAVLSDNLLDDPAAGGRVRSRPVGISGTVFYPLEVPQKIEERFDEILSKAGAIEDPFEQAFFVMVQLPYLQPFEDVNKRTSRLAANIPLIRHNLCPLSFVEVEPKDYLGGLIGVYELNRVEYLRDVFGWAYRRSCTRYSAVRQSLGEPDPFRLRHRQRLIEVIGDVVRGRMDKIAAAACVRRESEKLAQVEDRSRFVEMAKRELAGLHEGNFARFRIRPSEFEAWKENWK